MRLSTIAARGLGRAQAVLCASWSSRQASLRLLHATCRFSLSRSDSSQLAPSRPCFLGLVLCSAPARALSCGFERLKDRGRPHKQRPCPRSLTVPELAAKVTAEGTHRVERVNGASRLDLGSRPGCAGYEREDHSARRLWAQSSASGNSSRGPHQKNRSRRDLPWGTRRTRACAHRNRAIASWTSLDV